MYKTAVRTAGLVTGILALGAAFTAFAAGGPTLFGGATAGSGYVTLVSNTSDSSTANDYSGISFAVPTSTTFGSLSTLSTDYNVATTDCKGGSPRFQISVDTGSGIKNIFAYLGPQPNYTGCAQNTWLNDGNLLSGARTIDTSQLPGGTFYDTLAHAQAAYGSYPVTGIQLVADGGWAFTDGFQKVLIDNTNINGTMYDYNPPTDKSQCKNGGWQSFVGPSFKNQGDCVSSVVSQSPNK